MEFKTENGAEVKINIASFIPSMKLKKVIVGAVKESNIDIASVDLSNLKVGAINSIIQALLTADSSDKVEAAIFDCLIRCTYNGEKITRDTFEDVKARENYYEIVIACLKENLTPFFAPLFLKLNGLQKKILPESVNPKQK